MIDTKSSLSEIQVDFQGYVDNNGCLLDTLIHFLRDKASALPQRPLRVTLNGIAYLNVESASYADLQGQLSQAEGVSLREDERGVWSFILA